MQHDRSQTPWNMDTREALNYARDICARKEQCRFDISLKLKERGLSTDESSKVLQDLEKDGFIDEQRYARTYCLEKFRLNKWGKVKLRYMLKQKQLPEAVIGEALNHIDESEYRMLLEDELARKSFSIRGGNRLAQKKKLLQFGLQRGFEYGVIMEVIGNLPGF